MHVGNEGWPGWSDPAGKLLQVKVLLFWQHKGYKQNVTAAKPIFFYSLCCEYEGNVSAMSDREFHYIKHRDSATDQDRFSHIFLIR